MSTWQDLVTASLIGTERAGVACSTTGQVSSQGSWPSAAAYPVSSPAMVLPGGGPAGQVWRLAATRARSGTAAG